MPAFLAPLLAALFAGFSRLFSTNLGAWITTAMIALGLAWVTTESMVEPVRQLVASHMGGIPGNVAQWVAVMNFDKYISIILSAYAAGGIKRAVLTRRAAA